VDNLKKKASAAMNKILTFWSDFFGKNNSKSKTVLVVDDSDMDRCLYAGILDKRYFVLEAATGREGLNMARDKRPDLILLDIELPDLKGPEVCRMLKFEDLTRNIPIMLMTAHDMPAHVIDSFDCGADMYLSKPVRAGELIKQVEQALDPSTVSS
jgi:CheY-like chemotaxis protein